MNFVFLFNNFRLIGVCYISCYSKGCILKRLKLLLIICFVLVDNVVG